MGIHLYTSNTIGFLMHTKTDTLFYNPSSLTPSQYPLCLDPTLYRGYCSPYIGVHPRGQRPHGPPNPTMGPFLNVIGLPIPSPGPSPDQGHSQLGNKIRKSVNLKILISPGPSLLSPPKTHLDVSPIPSWEASIFFFGVN